MIHPLKIYTTLNINNTTNLVFQEIPKDLHEFIKNYTEFNKIKQIKINKKDYNSDDFINDFENKKDDLLVLSSYFGFNEIIKYLIINNLDPWLHIDIVKYFIENDDLNLIKNIVKYHINHTIGYYMLMKASKFNKLNIIEYLIEECGIKIPNDMSYILLIAIENNYVNIIKCFIEKYNVSLSQNNKLLFIKYAIEYQHNDIVDILYKLNK